MSTRPKDLSKDWIKHSPDDFALCVKEGEIRAESDCECGIKERHTHCKGCGGLASIGDWDAPPIATYFMPLGRITD